MSHAGAPVGALLVLVDPVARRLDGESVRIAKDVLSAGAAAKICLPESLEEFARALARRGHRQPVIVGDDRALVRAVGLLHRRRELADSALALVPVGAAGSLSLARALGVPVGAVAGARAVLDGAVRARDLLVDDSDGVVLGGVRIPGAGVPAAGVRGGLRGGAGVGSGAGPGVAAGGAVASYARPAAPTLWSACRSLVRTLVRPPVHRGAAPAQRLRLRVEADGVLVSDVDQAVADVAVAARDGQVEVVVRMLDAGPALVARGLSVTVSGADFRYRADHADTGPVRRRTWTVRPEAWGLTLPR
ncbi:diacylglycerol kinase [Streptomyces sp. G-G2]|uniref:diacylglycerol kinase n=1 Tax=Streptomyces sp. G-G2 TaxID=3046201 RepID=UPI0024B9C31D|nr:diacylglycerol kinase [Streptomyces sp. G-G2]MDJ0382565.1 diacylglycerol kinase [Streptomyces sp. G-G2]